MQDWQWRDNYINSIYNKRFATNVGERILVNGIEQKSGVSINDFSKPVEYVVVNASGEEKHYIITVSCFTKLPVLFIETEDGSAISSKNE